MVCSWVCHDRISVERNTNSGAPFSTSWPSIAFTSRTSARMGDCTGSEPSMETMTKGQRTVSGKRTVTAATATVMNRRTRSHAIQVTIAGGGCCGSISACCSNVALALTGVLIISHRHLLAGKVEIQAPARHQLIVRAHLRNLPLLQNHDEICVANGAQAVGDDQAGAAGNQ